MFRGGKRKELAEHNGGAAVDQAEEASGDHVGPRCAVWLKRRGMR
jgi:hypothetical protein